MKHKFFFFFTLLITLSTSCQKVKLAHLLSSQTWVVMEVSNTSSFAKVGDEFIFYDNRLLFKYSDGIETDGRWSFGYKGGIGDYDADAVNIVSDFGNYDFSIRSLTEEELVIYDPYIGRSSSFSLDLSVRLSAKE